MERLSIVIFKYTCKSLFIFGSFGNKKVLSDREQKVALTNPNLEVQWV